MQSDRREQEEQYSVARLQLCVKQYQSFGEILIHKQINWGLKQKLEHKPSLVSKIN